MGKLEESGRQKTRKRNVTAFILGAVGVAGMLGIAMVAPNVLGAMYKLGIIPIRRQKEIVNRARDRLLKQGLLKRENGFLRLTARGQAALRLLEARDFKFRKPQRWDGKWRVLIFDIPEYRRALRNKIRQTLQSIGFVRVQDSVWAYPYDCEDFVALLKADFRIGKDMLYMIVEELEGDRRLRRFFDLH